MPGINSTERHTQDRIIQLFQTELGYRYLGNWKDREENSNIEETLLTKWLENQGYSPALIHHTLHQLLNTAGNQAKTLYEVNKEVYSLLRYGVTVQPEVGQNKETVQLIDWENVENNDFAIAEEVTVNGQHKKRPDIVVYVNGITLGVLELKRSSVSVSEGIRQNLDNQSHIFIKPFFHTVQYIFAGNDFEGLRYGAVDPSTNKEKYYLKWKEVTPELNRYDRYLLESTGELRARADKFELPLDKHIFQMLNKERFLEFIHDFIVFDGGIKKLSRHNQYFGVKAAQDYIRRREGGIIWHTQGSGKSLTMVWLAKWVRENIQDARVLIITDREELDEQIQKVFTGVSETIYRTQSGKDLILTLNQTLPWLICSLVHKFRDNDESDSESFINELERNIPRDFKAKGNLFVFVDECHRTQSGKLHQTMKKLLPEALFIGFTGTPLLKSDKQTSFQVFGKYIHTYKFDEAVSDKVVLDLRYEARDVEQHLTSTEKIDEWFELKTKGLTSHAKKLLMEKWGTLRKLFSSKSRLEKIVMDIMLDMEKKERLRNGHGNALLISDSIYNACRYYELFQKAGLKNCAIITSFVPTHVDIKGEETGEGNTEKLHRYQIYRNMLGAYFNEDPDSALQKVETFEKEVKNKFINEPAQMKLLIVVNKLLTGFDAPSATYLYIDRHLQDHGLFQAVCRVNRLHGDDKDYGYIIDYMDLFKSLEKSYESYTSGALAGYDKEDVEGLLKDRLKSGKTNLDNALEAVKALCEVIHPPDDLMAYVKYFCGSITPTLEELNNSEPQRVALYNKTLALIRAFTNIADEMPEAGYSAKQITDIKKEVARFENLRKEIMIISGDYVDLKKYEPAMRQLIDNYIGAEESRMLADFDDISLVALLANKGQDGLDSLPPNIKKNRKAVAAVIENNQRRAIVEKRDTNPEYYDKMSTLLEDLIRKRLEQTIEYEEYLKKIIEIAVKIESPLKSGGYPASLDTAAKVNLYDNLFKNEELAIEMDATIRSTKKHGWRGKQLKEKAVFFKVVEVLLKYGITDEAEKHRVFKLVQDQQEY